MTIARIPILLLSASVASLIFLAPPDLERNDSAQRQQAFKSENMLSGRRERLPSPAPGQSAETEPGSSPRLSRNEPAATTDEADADRTIGRQLLRYPQLEQIEALENLPAEQALPELEAWLSDTDPVIRLVALEALMDTAHPAVLPVLSMNLADPNPQVRALVLQAMGLRGDPQAIGSIEAYLFDPASEVRLAAIEALSNLELDAAAQALIGVVFDPDPTIRHHAVNALGEIGGETAV